MLVAAISMAGLNISSLNAYRSSLIRLLNKDKPGMAVLPAYSALLLGLSTGFVQARGSFEDSVLEQVRKGEGFRQDYLNLHAEIAREAGLYLAAGTIHEESGGRLFHLSYCFDPEGAICGRQRQTHLSQHERSMGLSRGEELEIFKAGSFTVGLIVGTDARHPEVGRIFALRGVDLILHSGALKAGLNCWVQAAGMWSQVQQNQFFAVEAQLCAVVEDIEFSAESALLGPCEITPGQSGYLARGYRHNPYISAELDRQAGLKITQKYPLLKLLNPKAYI